MKRNDITRELNLTVRGQRAEWEPKSQSAAARTGAQLVDRLIGTWGQIHDYTVKVRADETRPLLERERLASEFANKAIKSVSDSVEQASREMIAQRKRAQERLEAAFTESDQLAAMRGAEMRTMLRSLDPAARAEALADPAVAKAAVCGPAALSGMDADRHRHLRDTIAVRDHADIVGEIKDLDAVSEWLYKAGNALVAHSTAFIDHEATKVRTEAPEAI